jgi:membrane-bound lytic murein transglycosylase F
MSIQIQSLFSILFFTFLFNTTSVYAGLFFDEPKAIQKPLTLLEKIKKKKHLDVVILNSPTTYYIGNDEKVGFEYDLISNFAKSIGVDVNLTVVYTVNEVLQKSREGVGDITVAGLTVTDERKDEFKFGPIYYSVQEELICSSKLIREKKFPKKLQDLSSHSIVVGKETSYEVTLNKIKTQIKDFDFNTTTEYSNGQLLKMTQQRQIDCTVADSNIFMISQRYYPQLSRALVLSKNRYLAWIIREGDDSLNEALYKWLNVFEYSGQMRELKGRYFTFLSLFDYYDTSMFYKRLEKRLPKYKKYFVAAGKKYNIPWIILAAVSYQESHWDPTSTSYTGVRGMMMLTNNTARLIGVKNRLDPKESIFGGAKYLNILSKKLPPEIKGVNRWAFILASYNTGYAHVLDAQTLAKKLNKNPNSWTEIKKILPLLEEKKYFRHLRYGYARGSEPVRYVDAIQNYYDIMVKLEITHKEKKKAKALLREQNKGKVNLKFLPTKKIWIDYINITDDKKQQTITNKELSLDPNKD